jgi:ASC-1-like (ASCH) protein
MQLSRERRRSKVGLIKANSLATWSVTRFHFVEITVRSGELVDGESGAAVVEITAIRRYPDFLSMVTHEGFNSVIPDARSIEEATDAYNRYYSYEDQETYGVLAIEIKLL